MESSVRVMDRAFDIIELLSKENHPMNLTEISKATGISKSTAYRLLKAMNIRHYVEKDNNGCYYIGIKLIEIVSYHINGLELQTESKPFLSELRSELNLTVHLGILEAHEVKYIEKLDLYPTTRLYSQVGYRSPAFCSSMGKCLLASLSGDELDEALYNCTFEEFTPNTITNMKDLKKHLKKVRQQGWAIDDEEYIMGHRCVGATIFDYRGDAIASISASGHVAQMSDEKLPIIIEHVKEAASQISRRMGYLEN